MSISFLAHNLAHLKRFKTSPNPTISTAANLMQISNKLTQIDLLDVTHQCQPSLFSSLVLKRVNFTKQQQQHRKIKTFEFIKKKTYWKGTFEQGMDRLTSTHSLAQ